MVNSGFDAGMGQAVAERTILRKIEGTFESWLQVAERVAHGNSSLCKTPNEGVSEFQTIKKHMASKVMITSGRHLEHGDLSQKLKPMEVFTNCSTSFTTFNTLYLLLNGSGVGRSYDDDLMVVNWDHMPTVICVLDDKHADYDYLYHTTPREAQHKYDKPIWIECKDSREGWSEIVETLEVMAFEKIHRDKVVVIDFSQVRPKNAPIGGMGGKPASGPVPLMQAIDKISTVKGMEPWKQALYIDHYLAECVRVGGVRRSARMSTKYWKDTSIFDFIEVKRPVEYRGLSMAEVIELRKTESNMGFLWSSNNSILVDAEFWELLDLKKRNPRYKSAIAAHARQVFKRVTECSYGDGTGEPGLINIDKLETTPIPDNVVFGNYRHAPQNTTLLLLDYLYRIVKKKVYKYLVNPCGEIVLACYGAYCIIGDLALCFAKDEDEMHDAARTMVRFLIRVNTMSSYYDQEVKRTNRIGVGLTGVHEMAWIHFGLTWQDLVNEEKSAPFWHLLARLKDTIGHEAERYSKLLNLPTPHTNTTIKPAGTTSKLFGLSEGWHLPSMRFYMRWVQFRSDSPMIPEYKEKGYPTQELKSYKNTTIIGFPTAPYLSQLNPTCVVAGEATPEEQYQWIKLGEKYWIGPERGNQISYTLKYDPKTVDYDEFCAKLKQHQSEIRCCSVMAQEASSAYEYLPEEAITHEEYQSWLSKIEKTAEDVGMEHVDCGAGCPISFK